MTSSGIRRKVSIIFYAALWAVSFVVAAYLSALNSGTVFFFICSGVASVYLMRHKNQDALSNGHKIILWLITIYFVFALFGRIIFMNQARIEFSLTGLIFFSVFSVSLYPLAPGILALFERLRLRKQHSDKNKKKSVVNAGLICGLTFFAVDLILTLSYYPCTMTNDSRSHWLQALSPSILNDYFSLAFNILLKFLFAVTGYTTPYIYVIFQLLVLSFVVGDIAGFINRRGVDVKKLVAGTIVFAFLPNTYMLLLYLSRNPLSAILCLGVMISLIELIVEPDHYLSKPLWYVKTIILILALYLVRENNAVVFIPLVCFVIWFFFNHKKLERRILILILGVIGSILLVTCVVYKSIDYIHVDRSHETVRPLLAPVGSAIQQDIDLPDDIYETAVKVLPEEEWIKRYDPFNSDIITWQEPKPQYTEVPLKEGLSVYLKMLSLYPDVVIKDRLDGMDCVWDINVEIKDEDKCPTVVLDDISFKDVKLPDGIIRYLADGIHVLTSGLLGISKNVEILDIFIWRNGLFVYLLMLTAVFLVRKKKTKLLWAVLPSVFILLTYVLVIAWQMYFYLWFFPLSVSLLIIVTIVECSRCVITGDTDSGSTRNDATDSV